MILHYQDTNCIILYLKNKSVQQFHYNKKTIDIIKSINQGGFTLNLTNLDIFFLKQHIIQSK